LTHRRALFANVDDFWLYDFYIPDPRTLEASGIVNEDVFAYSNRLGNERGLVVYHNKFAETRGWIKDSAASFDKANGKLIQKTLSEVLSLPNEAYTVFKDYVTGLEYIRSCHELTNKGLYVELGGYQCHVFLDWRFVNGEQWQVVYEYLNGVGIPSVYAKFDEIFAVKMEEKRVVKKRIKSKKAKSEKKTAKPRKNQARPKSTANKK
ncbi:MAG: alpha-amylase, partial [Chloroflexi bacterium]|nr:alpha-amylase [Chloroflexota bacterium]